MTDTIKSFVEAMKTQPLALALAVIVLVLIYLFYEIRKHELTIAAEQYKVMTELLSKCKG